MNDPQVIAENIGRAYALLCSYHEEVAGLLREVRSQLAAAEPNLTPISNLGSASSALYLYPLGVAQIERAKHWMPRDVGEFYAADDVLSGTRKHGIVLPYVYFATGVEGGVQGPWVTLGMLFDIEGGPRGKDIYKLCNQVHRDSLEGKAAWSEPGHWYGPERFAQSPLRLKYEHWWFPFAELLDGTPEKAVARLIVEPLRAQYARRCGRAAGS